MPKVSASDAGFRSSRADVATQPEAPSAKKKAAKAPKPAAPPNSFNNDAATRPLDITGASAATKSTKASPVKVIDNAAYFPELTRLLAGAKKSVDIVQYNFFSESGHGQAIADQLIQLKKDNPKLQVRLFIEADHGDGATRNALTMKKLKDAGIDVEPDSKNLITHAKAVCVDGTHVLAGSHNLTNTSMDKNNEVSLSINSPALAQGYESYFDSLLKDPTKLHPTTVTSGNVTMLTDTAYEDQLIETIKNAKTSLDASMYDLNYTGYDPKLKQDPKAMEVMQALADAAKRGVKVNVMLEQGTPDFAPEITRSNKEAATWLSSHGVTVHLDDPNQISHQKFIVADSSKVLMGSTNWTKSDFDQRHQINWLVNDPKVAKQMRNILQDEIKTEGVPLG